MHLKMRIKEVK